MRDLEIGAEHIETYNKDGFVVFEEFLDADGNRSPQVAIRAAVQRPVGIRSGSGRSELAIRARQGR